MFNLESAIAEWRQKMLAAGIETPVPLEELETHLREEIERQQRAGLAASQAFEIAVQHIGDARALKVEFRKAGDKKGHRPNRISWKLFTFTTTTVADQNSIKNLFDAFFRIFCGLFVGLVGGGGMLLFAVDQLTSMDFDLIYADGAFSPYRLMVGPAANLILGVAGSIFGIWLLWCARQMIRKHQTHPNMTSAHV